MTLKLPALLVTSILAAAPAFAESLPPEFQNFPSHSTGTLQPRVLSLVDTGPAAPPVKDTSSAFGHTFNDDQWKLTLEIPLWIPSLSSNVTVHNFKAPIRTSLADAAEVNDSLFGFGGRLTVAYGRWSAYLDGFYGSIGKNVQVKSAEVDSQIEMTLIDLGLLYGVGQWNLCVAPTPPTLRLDAGVAGRYVHLNTHLDTVHGTARKQNADWADPLAVAQVSVDFDRHWSLVTRGDIGGGVGADLAWSATAFVAYRFALSNTAGLSLFVGYKAVGENFTTGSGDNTFKFDAILHGPMFGLTVDF